MKEENRTADRMALTAMLLGISGMMLSCIVVGGIIAIAGIVVSIAALRNRNCTKRGFAITGMITSAIAIVIMTVAIFVFAGIFSYSKLADVNSSTNITYLDTTELP